MIDIDSERLSEIKKIISKIIETPGEKIGMDTHFVEELNADSMMALEIMAALEKKFKITIPEEDLPKIATLRQVVDLIGRRSSA